MSELLSVHRAKVVAVIVAMAVLGSAGLFYRRSVELKHQRAETAYFRARQAVEARNYALAEVDLRAVVTRYVGTSGGTQAAMALAQVLFETGKAQEGVAVLRDAAGSAPRELRADVYALLAAGHENLNQFEQAAGEYERAAAEARFPKDRMQYRASAARAYTAAGKNAEALAIWRELEAEPTQFLANEARVRIGELTAQPAG